MAAAAAPDNAAAENAATTQEKMTGTYCLGRPTDRVYNQWQVEEGGGWKVCFSRKFKIDFKGIKRMLLARGKNLPQGSPSARHVRSSYFKNIQRQIFLNSITQINYNISKTYVYINVPLVV